MSPAVADVTGAAARDVGHGHVLPRPDGRRARCGGPALCQTCQGEAALLAARDAADLAARQAAVGRVLAVVALLRGPEPLSRADLAARLEDAAAELLPPPPAPAAPPRDERVHGASCDLAGHAHGPACAPDCPVCGGEPL